jgi:hypothetical protein
MMIKETYSCSVPYRIYMSADFWLQQEKNLCYYSDYKRIFNLQTIHLPVVFVFDDKELWTEFSLRFG